jgi:hypothetical protein
VSSPIWWPDQPRRVRVRCSRTAGRQPPVGRKKPDAMGVVFNGGTVMAKIDSSDPIVGLHARWLKAQAHVERVSADNHGITFHDPRRLKSERRLNSALSDRCELEREIANCTATTLRGVMLKLWVARFLAEENGEDFAEIDQLIAISACDDLEMLVPAR